VELATLAYLETYARLSQLRGAVENAINNAATHKAVVDDAAVAAGNMDNRGDDHALSPRWVARVQPSQTRSKLR
jgi:hypothetical protein